MYIYYGKFNWLDKAINECFVIVFPAGLALNDPVSAYWQWTKSDTPGQNKINSSQHGIITGVSKTSPDEYRISCTLGNYSFDGVVAQNFSSLNATIRNPTGDSTTSNLALQYSSTLKVPSTAVYTGKLNWLTHAKEEMITLVIPAGVTVGAPVSLYYQWTVDNAGNQKRNFASNAVFTSVNTASNGDVTGILGSNWYYTFEVTVKKGGQDVVLRMTDPQGKRDAKAPYNLKQIDFRSLGTKKVRTNGCHDSTN